MPSNHLILCHPLLSSILHSIRVFSNESALRIRWPKYWSFSFSISTSYEHSGLISLRMDWLDLLAVQGTVKSLLQPRSSKASILWCSVFFMVQLSHPYMTTGETIALIRRTFVGKVMSLLFNILFRLVITFLPRNKCLNFMAAVTNCCDFGAPKNKVWHCFHFSPSICHEVVGSDAMILVFWMLSFKATFSLSSFTFIKRLFSSSSLYHKGGVICISEVIVISPSNLDTACASWSPAFLMMYSACKLNKQGDNIQPWRTPFPIWNQSVFQCLVLFPLVLPTGFSGGQVRWCGIPISLTVFHSLLWSTQSKALS